MRMLKGLLSLFALFLLLLPAPVRGDERSAARRSAAARVDEPSLIAFLRGMPKGADLHNHLGGALYPEDGLQNAVRQGLSFNPATRRFQRPAGEGTVPAARLLTDDSMRYRFLDAAGIRTGWPPPFPEGATGHDRFFGAFGVSMSAWQGSSRSDQLASVVRRMKLQNLQYLELMADPAGQALDRLVTVARPGEAPEAMVERLQSEIDAYVESGRRDLDEWDREVARLAALPAPLSGAAGPLTVRYLVTAYRTDPPEQVLLTFYAAFALMKVDRRVVGVNIAAAEDAPRAVADFGTQMRGLDWAWRRFDRPNVTLHAGELNRFLVPLAPMTDHIRRSIDVGHARRIGHGTAVAWENDCAGLLRRMRFEGIAIEVCPSSEGVILGAVGDRHPFRLYRRAGVPVTLNTDDEAVLRTNLTFEFVRAVQQWGCTYAELKELARNSVEYSFLPGSSLFLKRDYRRPRPEFRALAARAWKPTAAERKTLAASDRAVVQARLERAFVEFE